MEGKEQFALEVALLLSLKDMTVSLERRCYT